MTAAYKPPFTINTTDRGGRQLNASQIARRENILAVARKMIGELGFSAVTMDALAAQSGVTKKTLYDIYGSKEDLLAAAVAGRTAGVLAAIEEKASGRGLARLFLIIRMTMASVLQTPNLTRSIEPILKRDPGQFEIRDFFDRLHRQCLIDMRQDGLLADWVDIDFITGSMMVEQTSVRNFWGAGIITDDQLESFALLSVCRILLPVTIDHTHAHLIAEVRHLQTRLSDWRYSKPKLRVEEQKV